MNVCVLISGKGSNLQALITQAQCYKITHVLSNKKNIAGLDIAKANDILTKTFAREDYNSLAESKAALFDFLKKINPDYICLAGFMQIIPVEMVQEFKGRMINIHPSLLPDFPGLDTHKRAISAGAKQHGCTVHFVDEGVDTGAIIAQAKVEILKNDQENTLAERVLEQEHKLYPWVINMLCNGKIFYKDRSVYYSKKIQTDFILNKEAIYYDD